MSSPLKPILYNLYITILPQDFIYMHYIDDIFILVKSLDEIENKLRINPSYTLFMNSILTILSIKSLA